MIRNFLVCHDGSPNAETATEYGLCLTARLKGRLAGLHVLDIRMIEGPLLADVSGAIGASEYAAHLPQFRAIMQQKGQTTADWFRRRAADRNLEASCEVVTGHPVHEILERQAQCEMLILGQRGESEPFSRAMVGSTTDRVVRRARKPCLVTPQSFKTPAGILMAYDASDVAATALQLAAEFAHALSVTLHILCIDDGVGRKTTHERMERAKAFAEPHNCRIETLQSEGDAATGILEASAARDDMMVAIGAHSRSRLHELLLGSTTMRVISQANAPVLLAR